MSRKPLLLTLLGALLLASWYWPVTRVLWDAIDQSIFFSLNGSLVTYPETQFFWAVANERTFDLVPGLLLLSLLAWHAFSGPRDDWALRWADCLFMIFYIVLSIQLWHLALDVDRQSPTLVLSPAHRLTELVPAIDAKDESDRSFPGDHATVMWMVTGLFCFIAGRKHGVIAAVIALIFIWPRIVGGAHWFTDVAVGGGSIALMMVGLAFGTKLYLCARQFLLKPAGWLVKCALTLCRKRPVRP